MNILIALLLIVIPAAAMLTHIFYCFSVHAYVLLLAGVLVFPVGVLHGIGLWFGAW